MEGGRREPDDVERSAKALGPYSHDWDGYRSPPSPTNSEASTASRSLPDASPVAFEGEGNSDSECGDGGGGDAESVGDELAFDALDMDDIDDLESVLSAASDELDAESTDVPPMQQQDR